MSITQLAWLAAAGWFGLIALATFVAWRMLRGSRGAVADRISEEWTDEMEERSQQLFRAANRDERSRYRDAAVAIRGPTSQAEREVAEVLERKQF